MVQKAEVPQVLGRGLGVCNEGALAVAADRFAALLDAPLRPNCGGSRSPGPTAARRPAERPGACPGRCSPKSARSGRSCLGPGRSGCTLSCDDARRASRAVEAPADVAIPKNTVRPKDRRCMVFSPVRRTRRSVRLVSALGMTTIRRLALVSTAVRTVRHGDGERGRVPFVVGPPVSWPGTT